MILSTMHMYRSRFSWNEITLMNMYTTYNCVNVQYITAS